MAQHGGNSSIHRIIIILNNICLDKQKYVKKMYSIYL